MRFKATPAWAILPRYSHCRHDVFSLHRASIASFSRCFLAARSSANGGGGGSSGTSGGQGNIFLVPGATVATILMLGALHARRLYDDRKVEDMKDRGIEPDFAPDFKGSFLRFLPLRSISCCWGYLMNLPAFSWLSQPLFYTAEIPTPMRPFIYKAWARAFHSIAGIATPFADLEEAAKPLEEYTSLQEFFVRSLKEGSRPIDADPNCLVSPVDGVVLRFGELRGSRAMIEQVKGFSYTAFSLLGANSLLHEAVDEAPKRQHSEESVIKSSNKSSWWRVSIASPKVQGPLSASSMKGVFYCVLYLSPGDYHQVHSPVDWHIFIRRHFSGRLFPVNERATRTIRNLHIENERVVLEGRWKQGFMAVVAIGAMNIGSIELCMEPEFRSNKPNRRLLDSEPPDELMYEPKGRGVMIKKGEEIAAFKMGSTVVLVFEAPISGSAGKGSFSSNSNFV